MKISRNQIDQVLQAISPRDGKVAGHQPLRAVGKRHDGVSLSQATEKIRSLCQMIADMPDVRHDRIAEVMAAVNRGEYNPPSSDIAEKMLGRLMADKLE